MENIPGSNDPTESIQALKKILGELEFADKLAKDLGELHYCMKLRCAMASIKESIITVEAVLDHYKEKRKLG